MWDVKPLLHEYVGREARWLFAHTLLWQVCHWLLAIKGCLQTASNTGRVLRMSEGAWLEICDGRGAIVEAQLRGITHSNHAFATAASNPTKVIIHAGC